MINKETYQKIENNYEQSNNLPRIIDKPYPFLVIGDLSCVLNRIISNSCLDTQSFQDELYLILNKNMPDGSTFYSVSADSLGKNIERKVIDEINNPYKKTGVVNLDRYLCSNINSKSIFSVNVSRNIEGGLTARPGESISPNGQIQKLVEWTKFNNFQNLLIIDDVLAFGETLVPLINNLKKNVSDITINILVGLTSSGGSWSGIEKVESETGILPEYITLIKASPENNISSGMAIPTSRDFTFLGGKISKFENTNLSFPYFMPFSVPVISFMPKEKRVESARELLKLSKNIVMFTNNVLGRNLTISDLTNSGFGIPYTNIGCLKQIMKLPEDNAYVLDYLKYVELIFEENLESIIEETKLPK